MQKIKFLMLKQQDENVELQKEAEIALKQMEDSHRVKERDYKYDIRTLSQIVIYVFNKAKRTRSKPK